MALPSSGPLKFSEINTELERSSTATISINAAEAGSYAPINITSANRPNGSTPNSVSEWRGYNHVNNRFSYFDGADCDALANQTCWLSTSTISTGTTVMYIQSGNNLVTIGNGSYTIEQPEAKGIATVTGGSGVITGYSFCAGGGGGFD
jgi:hypothetical protein